MKKWQRVLAATAVAVVTMIALFLVIVAMQPASYRITRSAKMNAPPERVFVEINDFHHWEAWSPWAKLDPSAKAEFAGPQSGEGAQFSWSGNDKIGAGKQTIVASQPNERIQIRLDFERPMHDTCLTEFKLEPKKEQNEQTEVTWTMSGKKDFLAKAVCLFMNMDKMVGGDFEKGLANLKAIVEKPADTP